MPHNAHAWVRSQRHDQVRDIQPDFMILHPDALSSEQPRQLAKRSDSASNPRPARLAFLSRRRRDSMKRNRL